MTTTAIAPRFAQHDHKILLRFTRQSTSIIHSKDCEITIIDERTNQEIFYTNGWNTTIQRKVGITCKELNGQMALLYVLQVDHAALKQSYSLNEKGENGRGTVEKNAYFKAKSLGSYGRSKNDFAIEYSKDKSLPLSNLWIVKSKDQPGVMNIVKEDAYVVARIMRNKPKRRWRSTASYRDPVTVEVMPHTDLSLVTLCVMTIHLHLITREEDKAEEEERRRQHHHHHDHFAVGALHQL